MSCIKSVITRGLGLFCLSLFLFGCARKRKDIFSFPAHESRQKQVPRLSLPVVESVTCARRGGKLVLSWNPIVWDEKQFNAAHGPDYAPVYFMGYQLYRFYNDSFIPGQPLNLEPLQATMYELPIPKRQTYFAVRALFLTVGKRVEAPLSKPISTASL